MIECSRQILPLLLATLIACSGSLDPAPPGDHSHAAPSGGVLVPLGDHFANLELVWEPDEEKLTAYVLGGHAERAVRVGQDRIALELDGEVVVLEPVESGLSGETAGDTSAFSANIGGRLGQGAIPGKLRRLEVMGQLFEAVPFTLRPVERSPSVENGQ